MTSDLKLRVPNDKIEMKFSFWGNINTRATSLLLLTNANIGLFYPPTEKVEKRPENTQAYRPRDSYLVAAQENFQFLLNLCRPFGIFSHVSPVELRGEGVPAIG